MQSLIWTLQLHRQKYPKRMTGGERGRESGASTELRRREDVQLVRYINGMLMSIDKEGREEEEERRAL